MPEQIDRPVEVVSDDLRVLRPPVDRVRMEATRANAEERLFGSAAPARLGRYVLLGRHGDGGMGVVYAAYDPDLDRKVALKVLHPRRQWDDRGRDALIAEARALAKLDHTHVVKVHDILSQDGQVVIVMEWLQGTTLAVWEREPRSWREIVAVYLQAGHGLAAAHSVGVIHRDFKPSNAMVDDDARVRVLDFGLARSVHPDPAPAAPPPVEATGTGDMVGTLAYASPEQLAGQRATAGSDQFSFGVSMHRALEGVPPFAGDSAAQLLDSIRAGRIETRRGNRALPGWLRAIVARCLAADPAARHPSMRAVLDELARPRGWRRWRGPLVVGACGLVAALALVTRPGASDPLAGCDGGVGLVGAAWNLAERARVQAALAAVATPYTQQASVRVFRGLDDYRDRWIVMHRDACLAHRRGEQSAALLDRRMLCMQRRLGDLRASVAILSQLDAASARKAVDVVAGMPAIADCADRERLEADIAPPSSTAQRHAVDTVRARISHAGTLDRAGRSSDALAAAITAAGDAERTGYLPVVAEATLLQGRILVSRRDYTAAAVALGRARDLAFEHRMFAVAIEAAARRIFAEGMGGVDRAIIERDAATYLPISQSLVGDRFARPLLLNNLGAVFMAAEDRAQATRYFQGARTALAGVATPDLELAVIDKNLALVTADDRSREQLARGVWERFRAELGESHPTTLDVLNSYARYMTDPAIAHGLLVEACTTYATSHPDLVEQRIDCQSYQAYLAGELGNHDEELRLYDEIARSTAGSDNEDVVLRGLLAAGSASFLRQDPSAASTAWRKVVESDARSPEWWTRLRAAHAEVGLARIDHERGHDGDAARRLGYAIATYENAISLGEETEYRLRLAGARRALIATQRPSAAAASPPPSR